MARINGNVRLNSLGTGEIQNAVFERLATAPTLQASERGRVYYNTTDNSYYYNNGTSWVAFATGGNAAALQTEVDNLEAALGASIKQDGTFDATAFSGFAHVVSPADMTAVLEQLDAAISGKDQLSELIDVQISGQADKDVLYWDNATSKWKNAQPGTTSGVQGYDAALASIAGLTLPAGKLIYTTGTETFGTSDVSAYALTLLDDANAATARTTLGVVIGTDVQAWDADLDTIAGFTHAAGNVIYDTGSAWAAAGPGSTSGVQAYDADLVQLAAFTPAAGDFIVGTGGVEGSRWALESGSTVRTSLGLGDIATHNDVEYVRVDGTHAFTANQPMGGFQLTNLGAPTVDTNAATKAYVDSLVTGLSWKNAVVAATTANVDLATGGLLTVDGVTLTAGARVLVINQTLSKENGIYVAAAGAWVRAADADTSAELANASVWVEAGATYGDTGWTCTSDSTIVLGTDPVTFVQFNGASGITAGVGLSKTGNTLNVNLGAGIAQLPTDEVGVDIYEANGSLILTTDGTTRSTDTNAKLHLLLDTVGHGTLTQSVNGLRIADDGVDEYNISTTALGSGLQGGSGALISVKVDNSTIDYTGGGAIEVKDAGVTNAKLANSTITFGDGTTTSNIALGGAVTVSSTAGTGVGVSYAAGTFTVAGVDATTTTKGVASFSSSNFSVNDGEVSLDTNLDSLNDVVISSSAIGDVVAYNGSSFVNRQIYFLYSSTGASTTHVITHNLNCQYCNVTVVDAADDNVVIPQSIVFTSPSKLTVTFNVAIDCKVVIMGIGFGQ